METESSDVNRKITYYNYLNYVKKVICQTEKKLLEPWEYNSLRDEKSPSASEIIHHFGSWEEVFDELGYETSKIFKCHNLPNPPTEYEMRDFTISVQRYYNENGELPKTEDLFDVNYFPASHSYIDYFEDWWNVIRASGYIPARDYTDEELLIVLQKTSRKVDGAMSISDYKDVKKPHYPSHGPYNKRLGGWRTAKKKFVIGEYPDKYDCIKDIQKVAEFLGSPPTQNQYQVHSESTLSIPIILHYFDDWEKALTESNLCPENTRRLTQYIQEFYESTPWSIIRQNFKTQSKDNIIDCPFCDGEYESMGDIVTHFQRSHNKIYKQALLDEIRYLKTRFEKVPSLQILQEYGVFQRSAYEENYGSWNSSVEEAGYEAFKRPDISKDILIEDIQRVSEEHLDGEPPRTDDMDKWGNHHPETYRRYFDYKFWRALEEAGFEPRVRSNISKDYLLDEIRRVSAIIDRTTPRLNDIEKYGKCVPSNYFTNGDGSDYFDNWNEALIEAGFEPNIRHDRTPDEIIKDFHTVVDDLGRIPTKKEFSNRVNYSANIAYSYFGGWNALIREAGYEPPHRKSIPREELLDEIHRLYEKKERAPTGPEMSEEGDFSVTAYRGRFGTWTKAVREAGYEPIFRASGELHADWKPDSDRDYYGPNWREQRAKCIGRDGRECRVCEITQNEIGREPSVHHIKPRSNYKKEDYKDMNSLDNLIALCPSCHGKFEGRWQDSKPKEFEEKAREFLQK